MRYTDQFLDDLRSRVSISAVVGSRVDWDRKKTRANRGDYWGCCPFHGEKNPSFHCEDRKGRYHCFGCGATGDHFRFFTDLDGVSFPRAVEMVASLAGVSLPNSQGETEQERRARAQREKDRAKIQAQKQREEERERQRKEESVRSIWKAGIPVAGTPAEEYLRSRGIEIGDLRGADVWPGSLRYHASLKFEGNQYQALIGGVQAKNRALVGVWRIFLNPDGSVVRREDGSKAKMGFGNAAGGAVRLGPLTETLRLTEGIETGLGVMCLVRPGASVWATLSTSGMAGFEIPDGVKRLDIYADGDRHRLHNKTGELVDPPGIAAAKKLQERARKQGVDVVVHPSPEPDDWLNVWEQRKRDDQRLRSVQYL